MRSFAIADLIWYYHHHHNQFLTLGIWWRRVRMNEPLVLCPFTPLSSPLHPSMSVHYWFMSSFILFMQRSLGMPLFLFPSNLTCSALRGIRSTVMFPL